MTLIQSLHTNFLSCINTVFRAIIIVLVCWVMVYLQCNLTHYILIYLEPNPVHYYMTFDVQNMLNNTGIRWRHHSSPLSELCALERKIRRVGASMLIGPRAGCLQWERLYGWGCFHAHRTHYGPRSQVLFRAWTALGLRYAAGMYLHGWEHCESDVSLCQWWRQHRGLKQDVENGDRSWQSGILCIIQSWLCQSKTYHLNVL